MLDFSAFDNSAIFTMSVTQFALVISACSIASLLIGAVSLGGVIFLPTLIAAGVNPKVGIVTSFVATTPMSIYRVVLLSRIPGAIPWKQSIVASCGIAVGAIVGSALIKIAPQKLLSIGIGIISLLAGARDLADLVVSRVNRDSVNENAENGISTVKDNYGDVENDKAPLLQPAKSRAGESDFFQSRSSLVGLGILCSVVGVGSALTGTGGPMILFPILLFWKPSINRQLLVGMTTPMALVMVALTGATSMASGLEPDFGLVIILCIISLIGASYGIKLLTILTQEQLQGVMSILLLVVALVLLL